MTDKTTITLTTEKGGVKATFLGKNAKAHVDLIINNWTPKDQGLKCSGIDDLTVLFTSDDDSIVPASISTVEQILSTIGNKVGRQTDSAAKLAEISNQIIITK